MFAINIQRLAVYFMLVGISTAVTAAGPGRITVQGTQFRLDGNQVYMNGANTPWDGWDDFGSLDWRTYDPFWWDAEFARMKAKGINSTRVWISCSGDALPFIDANGYVTGVNQQFWNDLDHYMGLASRHQIYVLATMMSFDHVKNSYTNYLRWRAMFSTQDRVQAMVDNYILPFVVRYKDNPYLFAVDLCNEPEWMNENPESGNIPVAQIQRYAAMSAAAIHKSGSEVLVTIGSACVKWNSTNYDANYWSDAALKTQYTDADAFLDFYQIHYYLWMEPWFPLLRPPADHGINDRPLVIGEMPATDTSNVFPSGLTMAQAFESFFSTGYSGHYPWTTNGVDYQGSLRDFGDAALTFQQAHPEVRSAPASFLAVYNCNGATGGAAPAVQVKDRDASITLASNSNGLVKTGYYFGGWNTKPDGAGTDYAAGATYAANAAVTLFVKWTTTPPSTSTYTVAYNANGATAGSAPASQTKTEGVNLTLATNIGNLTKTGYILMGWNTAANGAGADYSTGAIYTTNADLLLYAKWVPVPIYTVTYNANGATAGSAPASQTKTDGVDLSLANNTEGLARAEYTFEGWNTAANGTGTDYAEGATYTDNANLMLYAKWTADTTPFVIVTPGVGNTTESGVSVTFTLMLSNKPADESYVLVPISSNDLSEADTSVSNVLFRSADWSVPQTVTVTGKDDDLLDGDVEYQITIGPTKSDDFRFDGLEPAPLVITNEDNDISTTYTINYYANGATSGSAPADQTKDVDFSVTLASNSGDLQRTGYTFSGWNTEADNTGVDYAAGEIYTGNADLTLYAKWTPVPKRGRKKPKK